MKVKDTYNTPQLDPIVNDFTSSADTSEIKLFGGDLNFLGNSPNEIDKNAQYSHLRSMTFRRVLILCEEPVSLIQMIRYGKILDEVNGSELRFYNPERADLRVRGRIIKVNGSDKLLMYNRIKSGVYKAIETDTANSNGALYGNIWELTWSLASQPTEDTKKRYISLFKGNQM